MAIIGDSGPSEMPQVILEIEYRTANGDENAWPSVFIDLRFESFY